MFLQPAGQLASEAYLIADSNIEIAGFEFVGKEDSDLLGLNARPASELLNTLLFPQLAVLGPFITEAVVGNFGEVATILTLTAYQGNGQIYTDEVQTNPVIVALDPGEILRADLEETFGFSGKAFLEGWLKVESTSQSINGSISYSLSLAGTDCFRFECDPGKSQSPVFPHWDITGVFYGTGHTECRGPGSQCESGGLETRR